MVGRGWGAPSATVPPINENLLGVHLVRVPPPPPPTTVPPNIDLLWGGGGGRTLMRHTPSRCIFGDTVVCVK